MNGIPSFQPSQPIANSARHLARSLQARRNVAGVSVSEGVLLVALDGPSWGIPAFVDGHRVVAVLRPAAVFDDGSALAFRAGAWI